MAVSERIFSKHELYKDPLGCPPPRLRGHIVNDHLADPSILAWVGVARFDIDLARYRGDVPLDWVVKKAYSLLEEDDKSVEAIMRKQFPNYDRLQGQETAYEKLGWSYFDLDARRRMIAKNLMYIEDLDLAQIDWERVTRSIPNCRSITLNLRTDSTDGSFNFESYLTYMAGLLQLNSSLDFTE